MNSDVMMQELLVRQRQAEQREAAALHRLVRAVTADRRWLRRNR